VLLAWINEAREARILKKSAHVMTRDDWSTCPTIRDILMHG
jgi:hypothetical protein